MLLRLIVGTSGKRARSGIAAAAQGAGAKGWLEKLRPVARYQRGFDIAGGIALIAMGLYVRGQFAVAEHLLRASEEMARRARRWRNLRRRLICGSPKARVSSRLEAAARSAVDQAWRFTLA